MAVKIKNIDWVKTEFTLGDVVIRFESADRPGFGKLVITNVDKTKVLTTINADEELIKDSYKLILKRSLKQLNINKSKR